MRQKTSVVVGLTLASAAIAVALILRLMVFNGFTTSWGERIKYNEKYVSVYGETLTQSDLEKIAALRRLTNLELHDCNVAECRLPELSFASTEFYRVSFEGTKGLWDTSFLSTLQTRELDLSNCTDVTSIEGLNWDVLEDLEIDGTSVSDLSPVRGSQLAYLTFGNTDVADLSPLAEAEHLYEVRGPNTSVTSIDALMDLPSLMRIDFEGCELEEVDKSFASPIVFEVNLSSTGLSDFSFLASCNGLQELDLAGNPGLDDLSWLNKETASTLQSLNVAQTGLSAEDLSAIARCTQLENLMVDGIELGNLDLCKSLTQLEILSAVDCGLTDVKGIKNHTELQILLLGYNQIADLTDLPKPRTDWARMELDLSHNHLSSLKGLPKGEYELLMLHGNEPEVGLTIPSGVKSYVVTASWFADAKASRLRDSSCFSRIYMTDCPEDETEQFRELFPDYRSTLVSEEELVDLLENDGLDLYTSGDYSWYAARVRQELEGTNGS